MRRLDTQSIFLRAIIDDENDDPTTIMSMEEFDRIIRDMNHYAPCEHICCRGISDMWVDYFTQHTNDQGSLQHKKWLLNTLQLFVDGDADDPIIPTKDLTILSYYRQSNLERIMEKTRSILLKSNALQHPMGGSANSPLPLLHTMLYWRIPNLLVHLMMVNYWIRKELVPACFDADFNGKLPLQIATEHALTTVGSDDIDWNELVGACHNLIDQASEYPTLLPQGRHILDLVNRMTPIVWLIEWTKCNGRRHNDIDHQHQAPLVYFLYSSVRKDGRKTPYFDKPQEVMEDLKRLIQFSPGILQRWKQNKDGLFPFLIPATSSCLNDERHQALILSMIYYTLRQDPSILSKM